MDNLLNYYVERMFGIRLEHSGMESMWPPYRKK